MANLYIVSTADMEKCAARTDSSTFYFLYLYSHNIPKAQLRKIVSIMCDLIGEAIVNEENNS
jgi:hypothetical protein